MLNIIGLPSSWLLVEAFHHRKGLERFAESCHLNFLIDAFYDTMKEIMHSMHEMIKVERVLRLKILLMKRFCCVTAKIDEANEKMNNSFHLFSLSYQSKPYYVICRMSDKDQIPLAEKKTYGKVKKHSNASKTIRKIRHVCAHNELIIKANNLL